MKILLATHQFLPEYSAGTEVLTAETAKQLQRLGHEVSVFAGHPVRQAVDTAECFESYLVDGISVTRFRHSHHPMGGNRNVMALEYDNRLLAERFRQHLEQTRPDVVHFFHLQRISAAALAACQALRIPTVLTVTDFWLLCPTNQLMLPDHSHCPGPSEGAANCLAHLAWLRLPRPLRWLAALTPQPVWSLLMRLARSGALPKLPVIAQVRALADRKGFIRDRIAGVDHIFVATQFMVEALKGYGIDERKLSIQPFGIRYTERAAPRIPSADQPLRIGFVGTLYEHKGAHVLLEALRSMPDTLAVSVQIYGDPGQFPAYVAGLQRLAGDDPRVEFRGTFARENTAKVLDDVDVLVVPSLWHENSPLALLHAQAAGCPVVGSGVSGISELIHDGVNGLLFAPGDAKALARALTRLAMDRSLLAALGARAIRVKPMTEYVHELLRTYHDISMPEACV
jgi:glycosyltransferase involved in cell wall biosynthesis